MSFPPNQSYQSNQRTITVPFDVADPKQAALLMVFKKSFGEQYSMAEYLVPPRYLVVHLSPGGAQGVER